MKRIISFMVVILAATRVIAGDAQYLTYDDFVRQVEAGTIRTVTLDQFSSITGTMVDGSNTNSFRSYAHTGSANDPLLTRFLKEHDVSLSMRDTSKPSHTMPMLTGFLFMGAPIVFLILLIVIIRKINHLLAMQRGNQQPPA